MAAPDLAALLTHPLLRLGLPQADIVRRAALLELALLRSRCAAGSLAESIAAIPPPCPRKRARKQAAVSRIRASSGFPKKIGTICTIFWFASAPNSRRF